jgi:hypothetical protein
METQTQVAPTAVPKIHAAIMAVMAEIDAIEKTRRNLGQNFMFRGVAETLATCHPLFIRHKMYVHPLRVAHHTMESSLDKDGRPRGTHVFQTIVYRATSAEDGSFIDGEASGEAIDYQDKSSGKVMSISFKCFIFQLFCIPEEKNESDPDEYSPNSTPTTTTAEKTVEKKVESQKADKPDVDAAAEETKKKKAIKALLDLLETKGVNGKDAVLVWLTGQAKRKIATTKDITKAEYDAALTAANKMPTANADVRE